MAVRKKGRRRIEVCGRHFVWYVCEDPDSADTVLHVASEDKRFIVTYHLNQPDPPFLIVLGKEFPSVPGTGGVWRRFLCPAWEHESVMTPGGVRRLIEWCLAPGRSEVIEVNWRRELIATWAN